MYEVYAIKAHAHYKAGDLITPFNKLKSAKDHVRLHRLVADKKGLRGIREIVS